MANKLINRLTREITNREALHIVQRLWGYDRAYGELDFADLKEIKQDDANVCRSLIVDMFKRGGTDITTVDTHFFGDGEWTLNMIVDTFNYLHKKGILI